MFCMWIECHGGNVHVNASILFGWKTVLITISERSNHKTGFAKTSFVAIFCFFLLLTFDDSHLLLLRVEIVAAAALVVVVADVVIVVEQSCQRENADR